MKTTFLLVMLTVVCGAVVFGLAMAVAYAVQSLCPLVWSLCSWQSWLLIMACYVVLLGVIRGIYELAKVVRDECIEED